MLEIIQNSSMTTEIKASNYSIILGDTEVFQILSEIIEKNYKNSQVFLLVDSHTYQHCLPLLIEHVELLTEVQLIEVEPGEQSKDLNICAHIWQTLSEENADRKTLLINLGGGAITDLGGFIASVYKRGIDFINIPTTLLSQVDASVGGKTGIDFLGYKNQLGTFCNPKCVIVCTDFMRTLPKRDMLSGMAEVFKHGLIADKIYFEKTRKEFKNIDFHQLVKRSIEIKNEIVTADPFEIGDRKKLNFGHTFGHAIESLHLETENYLLHGEAVAIGMIIESQLSYNLDILTATDLEIVYSTLASIFPMRTIATEEIPQLLKLCRQDKKNENNTLKFTLLQSIGKAISNQTVAEEDCEKAIVDFNNKIIQWT